MFKPTFTVIYVGVIALLFVASLLTPDGAINPEITIPDKGKVVVDLINELVKFTSTLNTALFGACAALMIKGRDWGRQWGKLEGYITVVILLAGATSYYGAYVASVAVLEMVSAGTIDVFNRRLQAAVAVEYYSFLFGTFLLGLVLVRMMDTPSPPVSATGLPPP